MMRATCGRSVQPAAAPTICAARSAGAQLVAADISAACLSPCQRARSSPLRSGPWNHLELITRLIALPITQQNELLCNAARLRPVRRRSHGSVRRVFSFSLTRAAIG